MAPADRKNEITEKEAQVLAMAWKCFKSAPEVDLNKLAKLTGYTNPKSVGNVLHNVKKKVAAAAAEDNNGSEGPSTPTKRVPKAKPASRSNKRKAPTVDGNDSGESVAPTPSKRARGKKAVLPKATAGDESELEKQNTVKEEGDDTESKQESSDDIVD